MADLAGFTCAGCGDRVDKPDDPCQCTVNRRLKRIKRNKTIVRTSEQFVKCHKRFLAWAHHKIEKKQQKVIIEEYNKALVNLITAVEKEV